MNSMTAALLMSRFQELLFGLPRRAVPEVYFDLLGGTLDEPPQVRRSGCRECGRWKERGDGAELPFAERGTRFVVG